MYVSHLSCEQHLAWGFNNKKALVIPNGVDTKRFQPNPAAGKAIRKELNIPQDAFVIGITARFHPVKNHVGFINSAALLAKSHPDTHFIMVGTNIDENNHALVELVKSHGLQNKVHMLGNREDIPDIVNAYDLAALTSFGEAFPLTLGEAMAASVPCVATDVGDNSFIIKDTGRVVSPANYEAIANAWKDMLEMDKVAFKQCQGCLHMLGNREDIPDIVNAYDLAALTSFGEAFPLTLGEAMAASVPCVATDVGDNSFIIKDTGRVVPPANDEAMANAWKDMLEMDKVAFKQLGEAALQRVLSELSFKQQVQQHESLYESLHLHNQQTVNSAKHA